MAKKLSFSIAVNLLTENFKKGTNTVKNSLRSIQMQVITFAAALGVGGLGLSGLLTRFKDVARETNRVITALKNVSNGTKGFADNLRFVNDMANKYGLEINTLVGNFAKFTASATQANMPMIQQRKVFESLSRASSAFSLSAEDTNGVFLALSQMMGKGKISSEELRKQMGERIPIAMQAMAKAAGVSMAGLEKLLKQGKLLSSDIIPKFADALNEMIPNVDTDNLETSLNRLSNTFSDIVDASGFQNKYKALVDWLNSTLQAATKNIQNIVVGIMAAIAFVITNASSKVLRGWWSVASEMTTGQQKLNADLTKATASRVAAENAMETARLKHSVAIGNSRIRLAQEVALKEKIFARAVLAEDKARLAVENANTGKRVGIVTKGFNTLKLGAAKLMVSLKSLWNSFAPAIIVSGLIAIGGYIKNLYDKTKSLERVTEDYNADVEKERININILFNRLKSATEGTEKYNKAKNEILSKYGEYLKGLSDEIRSLKDVEGAYKAISAAAIQAAKDRVISRGTEEATDDYLKVYKRNASSLKKALEKEFGKEKGTSLFDSVVEQLSTTGNIDKDTQAIIDSLNKTYVAAQGTAGVVTTYTVNNAAMAIGQITGAKNRLDKQIEEITSIFGKPSSSGTDDETTTPTPPDSDPDDKALRAAEKRLEALRKLDEEDRKRQISKQKFDLDLQQKAIDLLDDSFEKRIKQTKLNLEKEELEIKEYQNDLLKQQSDYAKNKYVSVHGTDKGFGEHFKQLQDNNFKDKDGVSILPEGLRPEDIKKQVAELLSATQAAQEKGLKDINKDLSLMLREQELMFASDLERKLAELDTYYNEQLIKAGNNADLIAQIEANRKREKLEATTDDRIQKLDFSEQLENERAAGLESIGMTEFVEERRLEITRKYLQLRIEALQALADAGNEDAKNQIKLYQESLKKLDTTKPAKSLKALADKAIFDRIKKGFEKAGDSAEKAETKTTSLLSSISQHAGTVTSVVSELQSMFGGLDEGLDEALSAVGNIASGFATGGIVGGAMAVIGEGMKLFSKASEAAARHQKALKEIEEARLSSQRAYNLLLLEQNLLLKEAVSIFGEKQIKKAANAIQNYKSSLFELNKEVAGIDSAEVVTGHKKTGLFGWGAGKDIYSSITEEYDDIIDKEGKLNKERVQNIIDTRQMSDETKNYLQNLIALQEQAEAAQEELRNYLKNTFGALGDDIMTSLENAIKDRGVNAWDEFGKAGAKVIEQLGRQIAYELFFADKFQGLQKQLEAVYGSNKSEEDIAREAMDLVGKFYQNIGSQMELAQGFMENWQKEAEKYGFELWASNDSTSQTASSGGFQSMDQDTGNRLDGRFAALQMSGLRMEGFLSTLTISSNNIFNMTISINDELQKHTNLFNEMKKIHLNSFYQIEGTKDALANISGVLERIDKNTSKL